MPTWFRRAQSDPEQAVGCAPWQGRPEKAAMVAEARAKAKLSRRHRTQLQGEMTIHEQRQRQGQKSSHQVRLESQSIQASASILRGASVLQQKILETPEGKRYCVVITTQSVEDPP